MKKILALAVISAVYCLSTQAADIVYPQGKYNKTSHDSVYFMGVLQKGESLFFRNEKVKTPSNGAFVVNVPLRQGRNPVFLSILKDGHYNIKQFYVTKEVKKTPAQQVYEFVPLSKTAFKTNKDEVNLYNTPNIDEFNVLSRLSEDTRLIIDGRQGDFLRVYLTPSRFAWIKKTDVRMAYDSSGYPLDTNLAAFYNVDDKTVPDLSLYRVAFSENLPYELIDTPDELIINIFNVANMNDETLILKVSKHELVKYSTGFSNGDFTLLMKGCKRRPGLPLSGFNIVIDAGHGGQDNGGLGIFRDYEKDINLKIAQALKSSLEAKGAAVFLTRSTDYDVPVYERVKLAKANDANILVSIHMASTPQGSNPLLEKGTSVEYYNESAKKLASVIQSSVTNKLSTIDAGISRSDKEILLPTEYLGVSINLCNMVNPDDTSIYKADNFVQKSADSICAGIVSYANSKISPEKSGNITNLPENNSRNELKKEKKWYHFFKKDTDKENKKIKVTPQPAPENFEEQNSVTDLNHSESKFSKFRSRIFKSNKETVQEEKPFIDTSVREKYQQEAIYTIDESDKKWYRPKGKKKRVKRPPREIKKQSMQEEHPIDIFASGDYEEPVQEELSLSEKCRMFFSKLSSYFFNAARN